MVGRVVRRCQPLTAQVRLSLTPTMTPFPALRLRIQVENVDTTLAPDARRDDALQTALVATHSMNPATVLAALRSIGGSVGRVLVLGCQPATVDQGMALSEPVQGALGAAQDLLVEVMTQETERARGVTV